VSTDSYRERVDGQVAQFVVRPARLADRTAIAAVADVTWHATYRHIFTGDFIADFLRRGYGTKRLTEAILAADSRFLLATAEDAVIGFGQVGPAFARRDGAPVAPVDLQRLYVLPAWQRRGVGSAILADLEAWLLGRGIAIYGCYVHSRNAPGIAFYTAQGFVHTPACDHHEEWYMVKGLKE
jgi:GNAT superfamily N-acetyltransferase